MQDKSKKTIFYFITILIPIAFFVILELALRVFNYGENLKLVQTIEQDGVKYYQLNKDVGQRYFNKIPEDFIPQLYPQTFEFKKSPETFRIFLLGGSTMAGFPYELNARINSLVEDRLTKYYPDKKIEVVNVGLSAINSFSVLDFVRELVDYEPDLFILYMGHNEFYGAYGIGSIEASDENPVMIRAYYALRKSKLFLLMRSIVQKVSGLRNKPVDLPADRTLMTSMVQEKSIPFKSKSYELAKRYFEENLDRIIRTAKQNDVSILMSTIFSNLRGQKPFQSIFEDTLSGEDKQKWDQFFQEGKKQYEAKNYVKSLDAYENALQIDSSPAILHFEIGNLLLAVNDSSRAKQSFKLARDFDPVRFRASTEFNQIIKKLCQENDNPMLDMEAIFSAFSPDHIIGNELVAEHLHPNFRGYFLMAKSFAKAIIEYNFIREKAENLEVTDDEFLDLSGVTILDRAIGDFKIQKLTSGWPYDNRVSIVQYKILEVKHIVESIVSDYYYQKLSWNDAHYRLAEYFADRKSIDLAIKEYKAVLKVLPQNYFPYFKIGNLYFVENDQDKAEAWFKKALQLNPEAAFIHAKLGMVCIVKRNLKEAIKYFQQALKLENQTPQLSDKEKVYSHYYLAACLIETDRLAEAKIQLEKLLEIDPENKEAKALLSLMAQNKKIHIEF